MQNVLIHLCDDAKRAAAFGKAAEADGHVVVTRHSSELGGVGGLDADIVAVDCEAVSASHTLEVPRHVPLLLIAKASGSAEVGMARTLGASALLQFDAPRVETVARLRAVSRLRMLRDEVASRGGAPFRTPRKRRIAAVGFDDAARFASHNMTLVPFERGQGAFVGVANGRCDAVLLSAAIGFAECRAFIAQMRGVASMHGVPALICDIPLADGQNAAWLEIGANDLLFANAPANLLQFQLEAACERRDLVEALKRLARDSAKQIAGTDAAIDPVTGLSGAANFKKALDTSSKRIFAQGKTISVLVISPDLPSGAGTLPDTVASAVADVLRRSLRGFDFASRISGGVFAILMPGVAGDAANAAAKRLCASIAAEKIRMGDQRQAGLTCSIGVATAVSASESQDLAERALDALHRLKTECEGPSLVAVAA